MAVAVSGYVAPGFEPVADAFADGFTGPDTTGAALHIRVEGRSVIDLWGGIADGRNGQPWTADTPAVIFSCTKGLMSILAARLVQEGRLTYDAPVSRYWPEFAAGGKAAVTVGQTLAHRAGLSAPRRDFDLNDVLDWDRMTTALAGQEPLWRPGTGYAYHALTHGWLAGEVIRRITGVSPGRYFRDLVAAPLGIAAKIGGSGHPAVPPAHIQVSAPLVDLWANETRKPEPNWPCRAMTLGHALPAALVTPDGGFNDPRVQAAEIPGAGGIATAKALATIWSATVVPTEGVRLLDDEVIALATRTMSEGAPVFPADGPYARWGMGFQLDSEARRYLSAESFGHDGAGGQVGFADPRRRVGFGYVTNWMVGPEDRRATAIIDALRLIVA